MTARQNILCGLHAEKDRQKREKRADEMMELLQIRDVATLKPWQLSGGQAQRTALGRILVNEPELLMLDEPFAALDTHLRLKLQMELKDLLSGYDRGIIMVTHDRDEAFRMCDRIGVIDQGYEGDQGTVRGSGKPGSGFHHGLQKHRLCPENGQA